MAKAKREAISKKLRFEVFKRDAFQCQYCGAHPPAVILHCDHIDPVANGGASVIDNLITACETCNQGKGARLLSAAPQSLADRAAEAKEREEQIAGYRAVMDAIEARIEADVQSVIDVYEHYNPGYTLFERGRESVRQFIERLGVHQTRRAMTIACTSRAKNEYRYFCGVCWTMIREAQQGG